MAKLKNGVHGGFIGRMGNVIGSSRNGVDYVRLRPTTVKNPQTEKQQIARAKFGMTMQFLSALLFIIKIGLKNNPLGIAAMDYAKSWMIQNAFVGTFPEVLIDYSKVILSEGRLLQVDSPAAVLNGKELTFTWVHEENEDFAGWSGKDTMVLVAYDITKGQVGHSVSKYTRDAEAGTVKIPGVFAGDTLLAYLFVISEDGTKVSTSQFVGEYQLAAQ